MIEESYRIRRELALRGWHSEDRITSLGWAGSWGFSIWFRRWSWQGKGLADPVCAHAHAQLVSEANWGNVLEAVQHAARLVETMETFTDCIPCINASGQVVKDLFRTALWRKHLIGKRGEPSC